MSGVQTIMVTGGEDGMRLDRWFKTHFPDLTHGRLEKLLRTGQVRVDGGRVKANTRLEEGQSVRVPPLGDSGAPAPKTAPRVSAEDRRWAEELVLHKDDEVLVINKPAGLAVQGGTKTTRHLDGMLDAFRFGADERPRLVHRLDRDTSGVLVLARTRQAAQALARAFKARSTRKIYWGLVLGVPHPLEGAVAVPLAKLPAPGGAADGERVVPVHDDHPEAQKALTRFLTVSQAGGKAAWLALMPVTGRTHQIRVHCAYLETPLVNDVKYGYGARRETLGGVPDGLHLHARSIEIAHPQGGVVRAEAPLPPHMAESWALFGFHESQARELGADPFAD